MTDLATGSPQFFAAEQAASTALEKADQLVGELDHQKDRCGLSTKTSYVK